MSDLTRRDLFKTTMAVPIAAVSADGMSSEQAQAQISVPLAPAASGNRERLLLDFGWRFHLGHASDPAQDFDFRGNFSKTGNFGPVATVPFDDSDWRAVDLPHDWAVELPFTNDPALASKGFYPLGRAYPATSIGWYRRIFELPESDAGKRISIEFDGAYREACVILNGFYIGRHIGGYDPFSFDVTDFATPGGRNVLLVRVDATQSDGWFYEGAGIYRHVWLVKTHPVHVKKWGTFVRSQVAGGGAELKIRTEVENHGSGARNVRVTSTILDSTGKTVGKAVSPAAPIAELGEHGYEQEVVVKSPALWSLENRDLYKLVTELDSGGAAVDRYETTFGIRTCTFDAEKGFFLNGKSVKLKGTCNHQDHAGVGAALPDSVQYYRIRKLQEMGCNALRTSHNPPTPELLDAADELGMLVFDETRMMSSSPEGLSQLENLVRRDRNHPSVFLWSLGNEEGTAATDRGFRILSSMKELVHEHDDSRLCSMAPLGGNNMNRFGFAALDVQGYNYADPAADAFHKVSPKIPVMGTEQVSAVATRGIYIMDPDHGYVSSYDPWTTSGRASCEGWWTFCDARPWLAGGFIWTGFDYRGEPSPYGWPNISSQYGIIDTCGFPKDSFYYFQSWWTGKPVLHMFPHWNWPGLEGKEIAVWVYSNLDRVELICNGESLGAKDMKKNGHVAWNVKYAPGYMEARGFKDGKLVMTERRDTVGAPAKLVLTTDRREIKADGEDVAMFAVEVQDEHGRAHPLADNQVTLHLSGQCRLLGVGNGDPTSHESDKGTVRKAFNGLCVALVQSTKQAGEITVEARSPGLTDARISISSRAIQLRPQAAVWERDVPAGPGITGLWRPERLPVAAGPRFAAGGVFTFRQNGTALTGSVEGAGGRGGGFGGGGSDAPIAIENGKIDGGNFSFTAGGVTYSGAISGDVIELQRAAIGGRGGRGGSAQQPAPTGPRPAIGPPPDGSDPSGLGTVLAIVGRPATGTSGAGRGMFTAQPIVLRRAPR
jgi:beta-galactosidase